MSKAKSSVPPQTYSIRASAQLRIDADHPSPQNVGALPHRLIVLREKRRPAAKQHAAVRRQSVVVKVVLRVVDHPVARAQFVRQRHRAALPS